MFNRGSLIPPPTLQGYTRTFQHQHLGWPGLAASEENVVGVKIYEAADTECTSGRFLFLAIEQVLSGPEIRKEKNHRILEFIGEDRMVLRVK